MKTKALFTTLLLCLTVILSSNSQDITILSARPIEKGPKSFAPSPKALSDTAQIIQYLKDGSWHMLRNHFRNETEYRSFLGNFVYEETHPKSEKLKREGNESLLARLKPYVVNGVSGERITFLNLADSTTIYADLNIKSQNGRIIIDQAKVAKNSTTSNLRLNSTSPAMQSAALTGNENFVLLPSNTNEYPEYFENYLEPYNRNKTGVGGAGIPFRQIDFAPLKIEFRWCKKVLFVNICGTEVKEFSYGKVLSGMDVPGNEAGFYDEYFGNVADVTAFSKHFGATNYLPHDYVLTCVIADDKNKELTFFREGLEPWKYGRGQGEQTFNKPIAVKEIGGFLYVLDYNEIPNQNSVKVFQILHTTSGDFGVNFVGRINFANTGVVFNIPTDIGGYEGLTPSDPNILLVSDSKGLRSIQLNRVTGLPDAIPSVKLYTIAKDPYNTTKQYSLEYIRKIDATSSSGTTLVITQDDEVIAFSNLETSANPNSFISLNYYTLLNKYYPNNIAYMSSEEKWYLPDNNGFLHTFTKDGRYSGSGGKSGTSEDGGDLYLPNAITPNTITDQNNDFRYRFIVASKWGYETGFKLFSPGIMMPEFKVFENLSSKELLFTFTSSGKWQHVEKGRGMTFSGMKVNGSFIPDNLWNTQIIPGTVFSPGNQLTSYPNIITITPASINTYIKRGWNKVELNITIFKDGEPNEIVTREANFYWLPSSFTPVALTNNRHRLNLNPTLDGQTIDYIYKPISLGDKGALFISNGRAHVTDLGQLTFKTGSTLYAESTLPDQVTSIFFKPQGKFIFNSGSYICINNGGTTRTDNPKFTLPDRINNFILNSGYQIGVNPTVPFPPNTGSSCKSMCEMLASNTPVVKFTTAVDYVSGPNFNVTANPAGTSFADRVQWEIKKVVPAGQDEKYKAVVIEGQPSTINLKTILAYTFEPCSEYIVTLSIACNQTSWVASASQTIATYPTVNAGTDQGVCRYDNSATMSGYVPAGGTWSGSGISPQGVFNTAAVTVNVPVTLTYTFTDLYGCTKNDSKIITVYPRPVQPVVATNSPVCEDETIMFNVQTVNNAFYEWTGPNGFAGTFPNPSLNVYQAKPVMAGDYTVKIIKNDCSSLPTTATITVHPKVVADAGTDQTVCNNTPAFSLSGFSPSGGNWTGNGVTSSGIFNPVQSGYGVHNLTYSKTDVNGCVSTDNKSITVGPFVSAGLPQTVCLNDAPFTLSDFSPAGGTWSGIGVSAAGVFNPSATGLGVHTLTYSYSEGAECSNTSEKVITVNANPVIPIIQNSGPVCSGQNVSFTCFTAFPGASYNWTGPGGFAHDARNFIFYNASTSSSGTYNLTVTQNGCSSQANTTVNIFSITAAGAGPDLEICNDGTAITLTGSPKQGFFSGNGVGITSQNQFNDTFSAASLNAKWSIIDTDNYSGSTVTLSNGNLSLQSRGIDVFENENQFVGVSRTDFTADFDVSVKVVSQTNTNNGAKAGIMAANNSSALSNGGFCYVAVTPGNGFLFVNDLSGTIGEAEIKEFSGTTVYPCWLRLRKAGMSFAAYYKTSENGEWTQIGFAQSPQNTSANSHILLFSTSKSTSSTCTTLMDDFSGNKFTYKFTPSLLLEGENSLIYTYTNLNGCIDTDEKIVNVYPAPSVNLLSTVEEKNCYSLFTSANFAAEPSGPEPYTFQWTKDGILLNGQSTNTITANEPGNYCVNMTSGCGNAEDCFNMEIVKEWVTLSSGFGHSLGIKSDGTLWSWGLNDYGQLGIGTTVDSHLPVQVGTANDWIAVEAGQNHSFAQKNDGTLWAWGQNIYGQLGDGTSTHRYVPVKLNNFSWKAFDAGASHTLAIKSDGTLWSWGANHNGQLGDGSNMHKNLPVQIGTDTDWKLVAGGFLHTLALKNDGSLWSWGGNSIGQLGDGTTIPKSTPSHVGTSLNFVRIACGDHHNLASKDDGTLWVWGGNFEGQLGTGNTQAVLVPTFIGINCTDVGGGRDHSLQKKADGSLWVAGNNYWGQLGIGSNTSQLNFVNTGIINPVCYSIGSNFTVVVKTCTDNICATGANTNGNLGNGTTIDRNNLNCEDNSPLLPRSGFEDDHSAPFGFNNADLKDSPFLGQNIPNPSSDITTVNYSIPSDSKVALLIVSDLVTGRKVKEYKLNQEEDLLIIDLTNFFPGIYSYSLEIDGRIIDTKRMAVIK